jgi:RsiW-degrading membrane proteinase PrsW (M82 family)
MRLVRKPYLPDVSCKKLSGCNRKIPVFRTNKFTFPDFILLSILGSLLLGLVWLKFFRKIDSFEPESWKATFLCLFLGAVSPLFIEPIVGLTPFLRNMNGEGTGTGLLRFALFRVAAIEELVKLLPFLLVLTTTKWVNESVDYIKYPALSALGFATVENMLYANSYGVDVLHIRGLLCVSGHIFYTALPGYFLWLARKEKPAIRAFYFLFGYGTGLVSHGFYDYFLFEEENSGSFLGIFSVLLAVGFMYIFKRMLIHTIRNSEFYRAEILKVIYSSAYTLFWGLVGIFIFIGIAFWLQSGQPAMAFSYWMGNGISALIGIGVLRSLLAFEKNTLERP